MSYILEALKKSQREREIGAVPSVTAEPTGVTEPVPGNGLSPWNLGALALGVSAIAIALYGAFGRDAAPTPPPLETPPVVPAPSRNPSQMAQPPIQSSAPTEPKPAGLPQPATRRRAQTSAVTAPEKTIESVPGSPSRPQTTAADRQRRPQPTARSGAYDRVSGSQPPPVRFPVVRPAPALEASATPSPPPLPTNTPAGQEPTRNEDYTQLLRHEAERLRARLLRLQPAEPKVAERSPRDDNHAVEPDTEKSSTRPERLPPATPLPPLASELPAEVSSALPPRQIIAHIYTQAPHQRFIIVDSFKLRQGETSPSELYLEEVRPDGVIFRFHDHRFFQPR